MKHIDNALKNLNERKVDEAPSILQRVLEIEKDPKIACVLALDMFLVGVDTVRYFLRDLMYYVSSFSKHVCTDFLDFTLINKLVFKCIK